jgi:hypothetical protein
VAFDHLGAARGRWSGAKAEQGLSGGQRGAAMLSRRRAAQPQGSLTAWSVSWCQALRLDTARYGTIRSRPRSPQPPRRQRVGRRTGSSRSGARHRRGSHSRSIESPSVRSARRWRPPSSDQLTKPKRALGVLRPQWWVERKRSSARGRPRTTDEPSQYSGPAHCAGPFIQVLWFARRSPTATATPTAVAIPARSARSWSMRGYTIPVDAFGPGPAPRSCDSAARPRNSRAGVI